MTPTLNRYRGRVREELRKLATDNESDMRTLLAALSGLGVARDAGVNELTPIKDLFHARIQRGLKGGDSSSSSSRSRSVSPGGDDDLGGDDDAFGSRESPHSPARAAAPAPATAPARAAAPAPAPLSRASSAIAGSKPSMSLAGTVRRVELSSAPPATSASLTKRTKTVLGDLDVRENHEFDPRVHRLEGRLLLDPRPPVSVARIAGRAMARCTRATRRARASCALRARGRVSVLLRNAHVEKQ